MSLSLPVAIFSVQHRVLSFSIYVALFLYFRYTYHHTQVSKAWSVHSVIFIEIIYKILFVYFQAFLFSLNQSKAIKTVISVYKDWFQVKAWFVNKQ